MLFCRCMRACELHPETCDSGVDLRQLPLAGIAPERTHGAEGVGRVDPGGLWDFLHLGLDVWVDLRGRGRQLRACHGSLPPRVLSPAESSQYVSSSWCQSRQDHSETDTVGENRIPRFTGGACRWRGSVCFPAASRGPQTHWGKHQLVSWLSSAPPSLIKISGPRASEIHASSRCNVNRSANPKGSKTDYITDSVPTSWFAIHTDCWQI